MSKPKRASGQWPEALPAGLPTDWYLAIVGIVLEVLNVFKICPAGTVISRRDPIQRRLAKICPPGTVISRGGPAQRKLAELIRHMQEQRTEDRVQIDRLSAGRGRPPNRATLLRDAFLQAHRRHGVPEDLILQLYDEFQSLYDPTPLPGTRRVRRTRTRQALQKSKSTLKPAKNPRPR
jgi:hypothetical protein